MTERKRRLYRAVITEAPDKPVPRMIYHRKWSEEIVYLAHHLAPVDLYGQRAHVDPWADRDDYADYNERDALWATFRVDQSRTFHAHANAKRRAALWRAHGCKVRVDVSEPIVWVEGEAS